MDKQKMSQLKLLIRQVVNEELEAIIPDIVSEMKKAMDTQILVMVEQLKKIPVPVPAKPSLTKKRISEIIGAEFDGDTLRASTRTMQPTQLPDADGYVPPLTTGKPAEDVVRAITRDYSDVMKRLNEMRPDTKGVYRS